MNKAFPRWLLCSSLLLLFISAGVPSAFGDKPPWSEDRARPPKEQPPPVSAPEPTTLILIGTAVAGAAGYYLGNKKRKK